MKQNFEDILRMVARAKRLAEEQQMSKMDASSTKLSAATEMKRNPLLPSLVAPKIRGYQRSWQRVG